MAEDALISSSTKRFADFYGPRYTHLGTMEYYGTHTALARRLGKQRVASFSTYLVRTYIIRHGRQTLKAITGPIRQSQRVVLGTEAIPASEFRERFPNRRSLIYQIDNLGYNRMVRTVMNEWEGAAPDDKIILVRKEMPGKTEEENAG